MLNLDIFFLYKNYENIAYILSWSKMKYMYWIFRKITDEGITENEMVKYKD